MNHWPEEVSSHIVDELRRFFDGMHALSDKVKCIRDDLSESHINTAKLAIYTSLESFMAGNPIDNISTHVEQLRLWGATLDLGDPKRDAVTHAAEFASALMDAGWALKPKFLFRTLAVNQIV